MTHGLTYNCHGPIVFNPGLKRVDKLVVKQIFTQVAYLEMSIFSTGHITRVSGMNLYFNVFCFFKNELILLFFLLKQNIELENEVTSNNNAKFVKNLHQVYFTYE